MAAGMLLLLSQATLAASPVEKLVRRQSITWPDTIGTSFYDGAFLADGIQGTMVTADPSDPEAILMILGHYKAIAHHMIGGWEFCNSRVFAGDILIKPRGHVLRRSMEMDIWNGEINGQIETDQGHIHWLLACDRQNRVMMVSVKGTKGETQTQATTREEWGITPRFYYEPQVKPEQYAGQLPPKPETRTDQQGRLLHVNRMLNRGAHVVASQRVGQVLFVSIGVDDSRDVERAVSLSTQDATSRLDKAVSQGFGRLRKWNRRWWHQYYESCSLELPDDPRTERFWWLQMYKFACCSAEDSDLIIDTQGPWITASAWAAVWWNLNVQLAYMPMYTSLQSLRAGRSLVNGLDRIYRSGALSKNTGGHGIAIDRASTYEGLGSWIPELGNLPWLLQCYWKYWRYSGEADLAPRLFEMLQQSLAFLKTQMERDARGKWMMKPSLSPEYKENAELHPNANYALMSARWVLQTLVDMNDELNLGHPDREEWSSMLSQLSDYPTDENGLRIGADQPFDMGHRHYSHLIGIYPYHLITPDDPAGRRLIQTSVDHWQRLTRKSGHSGYTYTGGAAMYATLGQGDRALEALNLLYDQKLTPNTMYREGGGQVVETPLSAVEAINYMLLQSWGGVIRILPALPGSWRQVSYRDLLAEGGFQVSASRRDGHTKASIRSLQGKTCRLKNPFSGPLTVRDEKGKPVALQRQGDIYSFSTQAGRTYRLSEGKP